MLTEKAMYERKWGRFPALGRLLGELRVPDKYHGFSSVSDNVFASILRTLEIAVTAEAHEAVLLGTADPQLIQRLPEDLDLLARELKAIAGFFLSWEDRARTLCDKAYKREDERRRGNKDSGEALT